MLTKQIPERGWPLFIDICHNKNNLHPIKNINMEITTDLMTWNDLETGYFKFLI